MMNYLPAAQCRGKLAAVWFVGSGIAFMLVLIQTVFSKYGGHASMAWDWIVSAIMPTLSLIVGAIVYDAMQPQQDQSVSRLAYRIAFGLSTFYLLLLLGTLLAEPLTRTTTPLQLLQTSRLWLTPVQGLVGLALGAFFVSRKT